MWVPGVGSMIGGETAVAAASSVARPTSMPSSVNRTVPVGTRVSSSSCTVAVTTTGAPAVQGLADEEALTEVGIPFRKCSCVDTVWVRVSSTSCPPLTAHCFQDRVTRAVAV